MLYFILDLHTLNSVDFNYGQSLTMMPCVCENDQVWSEGERYIPVCSVLWKTFNWMTAYGKSSWSHQVSKQILLVRHHLDTRRSLNRLKRRFRYRHISRNWNWGGAIKYWGASFPSFLLPSLPSPLRSPPFPPIPLPSHISSPSLRSRPPLIQLGGLGSAVSSPSGVWGATLAENDFGAF